MPEPIRIRIAGTGHGLPSREIPNAYFESIVETTDEWIRDRTGIRNRYFVSSDESTATLSEAAARDALADAGLTPADLDLLIVATVTPEHVMPSTACVLQNSLGCRTIGAIDISAACSGFVYGLVMAGTMIHSGAHRNVLVIGAETLSRITDFGDRASCVLFGDGAGAAVVSAAPRDAGAGPALLCHTLGADGGNGLLLTLPAGGSKLPTSLMTINERLHFMKMRGRELFKVAVTTMIDTIRRTADMAGISLNDLAMIVPHQSNARILEAVRERLGLPPEKMYVNIDRMGNTSAASIPIALNEVRRAGRIGPGDRVMLVAFGAGLTWGSALLRM